MKDKAPAVVLKLKPAPLAGQVYEIVRLNNIASINVNAGYTASEQSARAKFRGKAWRIGDTISVDVADFLCEDHKYDVTITT